MVTKTKVSTKKKHTGKDRFYAKLSFWLAIFFWVPLFNIGLSIVSVYFGFRALALAFKYPKKFGGQGYAIAGLVISLATLAGSLLFAVVYMLRRVTCASII